MSVLDGVVHAEGPHAPIAFRSVFVHPFMLPALLLSVLAIAAGWLLGSSNPFTPAGYVGYLTKGAVFGQSRFYGIQRGPTSPGRTWLLDTMQIIRGQLSPMYIQHEAIEAQKLMGRN